MSAFQALEERLGHRFRDVSLLKEAMTHPSALVENPALAQSYQRLEFLGDAILQFTLTWALFERFPTEPEGRLTQARIRLVNNYMLAERARDLGLGDFVILGRGERLKGGAQRQALLADLFEAVIGALARDGGPEVARGFLMRIYEPWLDRASTLPNYDNPKGDLQEQVQARGGVSPMYELIGQHGPDHERVFESAVLVDGVELGRGTGPSKQAAEVAAAIAALQSGPSPSSLPAMPDEKA